MRLGTGDPRRFAAAIALRHRHQRRQPGVIRIFRLRPLIRRALHRQQSVTLHHHFSMGHYREVLLAGGGGGSTRHVLASGHRSGQLSAGRGLNPLATRRLLPGTARRSLVRRAVPGNPLTGESGRQMSPAAAFASPVRSAEAPPVPRVVRRPSLPQPEESRRASEVQSPGAPARRSTTPPTTLELPMAEVHRLTDHVLRTLDRRVGAFRERLGRT
jgi:hypothetical protein